MPRVAKILGSVAAVATMSLWPYAVQADCTISNGVATCTGDLQEGVRFLNEATELIVEQVQGDIEPAAGADAVSLANEGGKEESADGAAVSYDGNTIFATVDGVVAYSQGGDGEDGSEDKKFLGNATGDKGHAGGNGGDVSIDFTAGSVQSSGSGTLLVAESLGGGKGNGGEGLTDGGTGTGGEGSLGAAAGSSSITVVGGTFSVEGTDGHGLQAFSLAGEGGSGGEGRSGAGTTYGGSGGDGGFAASAGLSIAGGSFSAVAGSNRLLEAASVGGKGGGGGEGHTDTTAGAANGGQGGKGGDSEGASLTITGGSFLYQGNQELLLVESIGGDGGDGGYAENAAANANGGEGGEGGSGGPVTAALDAGLYNVGADGSTAIFLQSLGGNGGDGGEGKVTIVDKHAEGGDGGKGGSAGNVTVTSSGPGVSIETTSTTLTQHALRVESIAGSGGDGGEGDSKTFGDGFGGDGGQGGAGGTVSVQLLGDIETAGPSSQGIFARSYGGAGGDGGDGYAKAGKGQGGAGAGPGPAGDASVDFSGSITTGGEEANAIIVQSVGGFSGNAGDSAGFVAYGAGSESAGNGGMVSASVADGSTITTKGASAGAVLAQSIGGGGGRGSSSASIGKSLGGSGSAGGDGGQVTLTAGAGKISTEGQGSRALHAASRGGGGGDGGSAVGIEAIGGSGGSGGNGGLVTVTNAADLKTLGDQADALYAASLGGGGGSAHSTIGILALGGSGGDGGDGGEVTTNSSGGIFTNGEDADGIFLSSVGGGGGDGSSAVSASALFSVAIGGKGGGGGSGGAVTFDDQGATGYSIETAGERARGLAATSVGGGGGDGGTAVAVSGSPVISVSLGASGSGGHGGAGGDVTVNSGADISTYGGNAAALLAHSTGGGGGNAGTTVTSANGPVGVSLSIGGDGGAGGDGGTVTVDATGDLKTEGDLSAGLSALSHGGGGGNGGTTVAGNVIGGVSVSTAVGGSGAGGGAGGDVSVSGSGSISTEGNNSPGLYAHSVSGSGGVAGTTVAATAVSSVTANVSVGGKGGSGKQAGTVTVDVDRTISTKGDISPGLTAISQGGTGGHSGVTVSGSLDSSMNVNATVGGSGGKGGAGNTVTVTSNGAIATEGNSSGGLIAQSVGGGGGASHFSGSFSGTSDGSINTTVGGRGGTGGDGGAVNVSASNSISTAGHNAPGISAVSVGGGGGDSGTAVSGALASGGAIGVTVGGDGGASGDGGDVEVSSYADVTTSGENSVGIRARSVALSGGSAGVVASGAAIAGGAVNVSIGGSGGDGGTSGTVDLISLGDVSTSGGYATALVAQSAAGGGGSATGSISATGLSMGNVSVTLGGDGGTGGTAGDVEVASNGALSTTGHHARGIQASSHGGAGGDGGFAAEGSFTAGEVSGQLGVTIGGKGGGAGQAGAVTVSAEDSISTGDFGATGILAQSIGGNGGNGGNVYTGNLSFSSDGSAQVDIDIGGAGGGGAKAGKVTVTNAAQITTDGFLSNAIQAQSIGGNGGNGGSSYSVVGGISASASANVQVDVGGGGGNGATAEAVEVTNSGDIGTAKGGSYAIYAQSIGGGGGDGGSAANINLALSTSAPEGTSVNANVGISVGGSGGSGNDGNSVTITNSGDIVTTGETSKALVAHSVGGGGGNGGAASSTTISFAGICNAIAGAGGYSCSSSENPDESTTINPALTVVVGGNGAGGGDGGDVTVTNKGGIATTGEVAHALVAQSHGGGGGNGGEGDLGLAGWTTNATAESIDKLTNAFTSLPSFSNISVAVGGKAGAAGEGGKIVASNSGDLVTEGAHSFGMHLQSIGGGGGNGGAGSSGLWSLATVGGRGSGGGNGGDIQVTHSGFIGTAGDGGIGIFAQSVGGGGGTAGDVEKGFAASWENLNIGIGVGVQENAGAGGDGGDITVTTSGKIETEGARAHGMVLQSVGGSGGVAGISGVLSGVTLNNFVGNNGDAGNGGTITVNLGEAIEVSGQEAHGIFAQSVSGTGGSDTSGAITLNVNADITASGEKGRAILAQSASGDGNNAPITITIAEGATVSSAADSYETIGLFDGQGNEIVNNGSLVMEGGAAASGYVVRTNGTAYLQIENSGLIEGSILTALSSSASAPTAAATAPQGINFLNQEGAVFGLGSTVDLGGGAGALISVGTISAGGKGQIARSALNGQLQQGAGGQTWVDFDFSGGVDLIVASNGSGNTLVGSVVPNPLSGTPKTGEKGSLAILRSNVGLVTDQLTVADTATIDYSLRQRTNSQGQETLLLSYAVDYTPWNGSAEAQSKVPDSVRGIINDNHTAFGDSVSGMIDASTSETDDFVEELSLFLATTEDVASLVDTYDRYAPGEIFAPSDAALFSSLGFAGHLNSCPQDSSEGSVVFTRQGSCLWLQAAGGGISRQRTGNSIEYDETLYGLSLGGQTAVGEGYFVGLAFGWEHSNLSNERFSGDGSRFQGGIAVKKEIEATTISASFSGGVGNYDLDRGVFTPSGLMTAESSPTTNWISGHARVTQVVDLNEVFYLKPWFDLGVDHQWQGGFSETGAGNYGLDVAGFSQTLVTVNPVLQLGSDFDLFGAQANATASAGLLAIVSGRDRETDVRLRGMGGTGPAYQVSDQARPVFADIGASLNVVVHERAVVSVGGQALLAGHQQEYGGTGRISIFF